MTPGEILQVTRGMAALGVSGFKYRECEVMFFTPELQREASAVAQVVNEADDDESEKPAKRLESLRRQQAELDLYGATG